MPEEKVPVTHIDDPDTNVPVEVNQPQDEIKSIQKEIKCDADE